MIGTINNGESGLSARSKLNQLISTFNDYGVLVIFETAANLTAANIVLEINWIGIESDDLLTAPKIKIADGVTAWNDLPYFGGVGAQTLQQITTNGNITTNDLIVKSLNNENAAYISPYEITSEDINGKRVSLKATGLEIKTLAGVATIKSNLLDANRIHQLPNESGTLALLSNVTGTNSGTNTGDETTATIQTKRPLKTIEGQSLEGSGNIDLVKADVGLSNVDNTSDVNKPVSNAQAAADTAVLNSANNYTDNLVTGLSWKKSVLYATNTGENLSLSGLTAIIDGASRTLLATDRILVKNQTTQSLNGIYNPSSGAWTMVTDADTSDELLSATVYVREGNAEKNRVYSVNVSPITLGTTAITLALISGAGAYTYGAYLKLTGNVFDIDFATFSTSQISEGSNLYFTNARALAAAPAELPASVAEINAGINSTKFANALNLETSKYLTQYGTKLFTSTSGTNTYVATLTPAITSYQTGATYRINFTNANTATAPTINFNSLGAKTLTKKDGSSLAINDITAGWYTISYDGTTFRGDFGLTNQLNAKADKVTGLVSGGVITIQTIDGTGTLNDARVAAATWYLSSTGLNYSTAVDSDFLNLALSSAGNQRYVGFYGDSSSVITKVEGSEAITASYPATPVNTALIGYVLIGDAGASPTEPIGGYLPKADKATPADAVTGTNDALYVTSLSLAERMKVRTVTVASSATPSFNHNNGDIARLTGLATAITNASTNLTGTVYHGKVFSYEITDNGTARAIAWGTSFAATSSLSLPTTTVISTLLRCLFQYNAANSKWEIIAVI